MTDERKEGGLALFDMDGTLLPWDTQYVFSCFVVRRHPWRRLLLLFYLACLPLFFLGIWDETRMKRAFLCYLWRLPTETVLQYGREFARLAFAGVYPELRERLQRHQERGDACIMVSASPSFYAEPLGMLLGFDAVLGTDVALDGRMPLMPELPWGNNKGRAKVERLRNMGILPENGIPEDSIAYSDSAADIPMLLACRRQVLVNPSRKLKTNPRLGGAECLYPSTPWRNSLEKKWEIALFVMGMIRLSDK